MRNVGTPGDGKNCCSSQGRAVWEYSGNFLAQIALLPDLPW